MIFADGSFYQKVEDFQKGYFKKSTVFFLTDEIFCRGIKEWSDLTSKDKERKSSGTQLIGSNFFYLK